MSKALFATANKAFSLLSLLSILAIAACSSAAADEGGTDPQTTQGAPVTETSPNDPATPGAPVTPPGSTPATPPGSEPAAPPATEPTRPMPYRGINLAGGEFGSAIPGVAARTTRSRRPPRSTTTSARGMNTFRIGFKWERLQPAANGAFDATYNDRLTSIVSYASSKGAKVILNPHNFARYYGNTVGSAQVPSSVFADFWSKLSSQWAKDPNVMFNLVNEPHDIPTEQWVDACERRDSPPSGRRARRTPSSSPATAGRARTAGRAAATARRTRSRC